VRLVATADPDSLLVARQNALRLLSANGRYFAFPDNSASIAARFGFNNAGRDCDPSGGPGLFPCGQVYLYDVEGDGGQGALSCAACRTDGRPPRGNAGDPRSAQVGRIRMNSRQVRTVTDDGSVFFATLDGLVSQDGNEASDVYRYRGGTVDLVSRAAQGTNARLIDATPDGASVFIATDDPIARTDTDRAVDIYLARAGIGLPDDGGVAEGRCSGSDCRPAGVSGQPPTLLGSSETLASPTTPRTSRATVRVRGVKRLRSSVRVELDVSAPGRVRVSGSGLRVGSRDARHAGRTTVTTRLTEASLRRLRRVGRVSLRVRAFLSPTFGVADVSVQRFTVRN
jgi:hypothetical protein